MTSFFTTVKSAFTGGSAIENPPYEVIHKYDGYEERLYPARKWVKTQMQSMSRDSVTSAMFWKLFNYISGNNGNNVKVPMTAPVTILVEPSGGPTCESTFTEAFYVPEAFQNDTPVPSDSAVSIEERPELRVLVRAFEGPVEEEVFVEQATSFGELIMADNIAGVDFEKYLSVLYYPGDLTEKPKEEIWFIRNK